MNIVIVKKEGTSIIKVGCSAASLMLCMDTIENRGFEGLYIKVKPTLAPEINPNFFHKLEDIISVTIHDW